MFRTKCATISPTWTLSCQKIADPIGSVTISAAHPPDCVRFRANGSHHPLEPTAPSCACLRFAQVASRPFDFVGTLVQ
jgi:hypothetical protein